MIRSKNGKMLVKGDLIHILADFGALYWYLLEIMQKEANLTEAEAKEKLLYAMEKAEEIIQEESN